MLEMLDDLIRTGELAGASGNGTFFTRRGRFAHHFGVQRAGTDFRKLVRFGAAWTFFLDDAEHLRNDVAGALNFHRIADTHIEPGDFVGVVQRRVLHHDAADRDRLELGDRRERAGAADLDFDVLEHGDRTLGGKFVRDRPARRARYETQAFLPIEPVE